MRAGDGLIHPRNSVSVQELFSVSQTAAYPFVAVGNHTQRNHAEQDRRRYRPRRQPHWVRLLDQGRAAQEASIRILKGGLPSVSAVKTDTAILLGSDAPHDVLAFGRDAYECYVVDVAEAEQDGERFELLDEGRDNVTVRTTSGATSMLFRWFKMGLHEHRGHRTVDAPVATAAGGETLRLIDVMIATLRHIKDDIIAHLSSVSEMTQTVDDVKWVVTIPAIHDDFTKRFMRVAVYEAGITSMVDAQASGCAWSPR